MKKALKLRVVVATTIFMMTMGFMSVNAQFLYMDSHIFVGQPPSNYATVSDATSPGIFIGPTYGIEYWDDGLNFWLPNTHWTTANYKLFVGDDGNVGVGRKPTTYKLEVEGQVWTTAGLLITSDETLKRNVRNMNEQRSDYVGKLKQLDGKTYEKLIVSGKANEAEIERMVKLGKISKEDAASALKELNETKKDTYKSEYGFIAQDVKNLFPELVEENAEGILSINYTGLIQVLLEVIKDLQTRIETLEQGKNISIRSSAYTEDKEAVEDVVSAGGEYLSQNIPNPVDGSTVIKYNLPEGTTQTSITILSIGGSVIKTIPVDANTGNGSVTLYATDLAKGINVYNLTANGVVLGSRRMINP
jgi:hypothetical protein